MLNANGKALGFFCPILKNGKGGIFPFLWDNSIVLLEGAVHIPDVPSWLTGAWFEILSKILIHA